MNTEKIKEVFNEKLGFTNQNKVIIIVIAVLCIVAMVAWDVLGGNNVQHNGVGADTVRSELSTVGAEQREVDKGLQRVSEGLSTGTEQLGRAKGNIGAVQNRLSSNQATLTSSSEIIADCQRILGQVRARGEVRD